MSDRLGNEKGQIVAIFALMLTAFLSIAALALDSGNAYYQRRKMDIAATAAARAAAYQLATGNTSNATSTAETYAHYNGAPGTGSENVTVQYSVDGTTFSTRVPTVSDAYVRVTAQNPNFNTFFLGIVGMHTLSASASAAAVFGALGSANCATLFPAIVSGDTDGNGTYDFNFTLNACYIIRDDGGSPGGGSFGWVDLNGGGGGSSELSDWINSFALYGNTGCNNTISVGADNALLETETGAKASLQSATNNLIGSVNNQVTVAIYDNFGSQSSGCTDHVATGSNLCYRVKGFGRFQITDVWLTGSTYTSAVPNPDTTPCAQSLFGTSKGILGMFVGYVDPFGQVSPNAQGPAQALNVIE